jgi:adenine-specific DNA-methyltransferase
MSTWDILLGSATELDLLRVGEALKLAPRTAMGVLQHLLSVEPRPRLSDIVPCLSDDTVRLVCARAGLPLPSSVSQGRSLLVESSGGSDWISVEAPRRKPRLAWQGKQIPAAVTSVPTQILEVVSPGLAERRDLRQPGLEGFSTARTRAAARSPVNRLIWTNDNLVALQTLLEERDPLTHEDRYRGKVDLIYIDPPFMVNGDFVADNSIAIDVDSDHSATKEPSLVEILAYKDTWREGLDSFLSMIRARLLLLKELLSPTGSIYIHLDWHAAHYVKVLMDEVFGYENFQSEVIWKRTSARGDTVGFNLIHDVILGYSAGNSPFFSPVLTPHNMDYIRQKYSNIDEKTGRRFRLDNITSPNPRPNMTYVWKGYNPPQNGWRYSVEKMQELDNAGLIVYPKQGMRPQLKRFLEDDGQPLQSIWDDLPPANSQAAERLGYPTQKPVALLERIISASCPPGGLVLDCFMGSGTTVEAAERLGRRWIGIDNGKYALHLARKRLIQLHNQPMPPEREAYEYVECDHCNNIERKTKKQRSPGAYVVRPFSVESMGVYQRGEAWLEANGEGQGWRAELVKVFGGEPVVGYTLLHGRDGQGWIHVGPLDAPVPARQAWAIAREAADTDCKVVNILTADLDTLPQPEREEIREKTGVQVWMRIIPRAAIEQVALRLRRGITGDGAAESMAVPAFYTPLAIGIRAKVEGMRVRLTLERCEVDVQSFIRSQRPALPTIRDGMNAAQRKKAEKELERWAAREQELESWLQRAHSWTSFVDFWAVDWDYADNVGPDGRPVFDTEWQSFRIRRGKDKVDPIEWEAETRYERPGRYQVAARVTDVFGNDGIAVVDVEVGR